VPGGSGIVNPGEDSDTDAGSVAGSDGGPAALDRNKGLETCAQQDFRTREVVPDILIVLDRSSSMQIGTVDRWTPAVAAIKSLTKTFDQGVNFGLMTFPGSAGICAPGELEVAVGSSNAASIARELASQAPGGSTPTGESLQAALAAFRATAEPVASDQSPRYVLLVTDGQPSCPTAEGYIARTEALEVDTQLAIQAIDGLRAEGINTFVLGYDATTDPRLASALTEFAQHGGTERYYLVQDEVSLRTALDTIADAVITCSFEFDADVTDPELVHVQLNGKTLRPDDPNGWEITGRTVTIRGESCTTLQKGIDQRVEITMECTPVIYL
jgi:Mg-chelatase subunit ChlD